MNTFSAGSNLLVNNWETVRDIFEAEKQLRKELFSVLLSLRNELKDAKFIEDKWEFVERNESQVYISNQKWLADNHYIVWIGIEKFDPEHVFGIEMPPCLYVWVSGRRTGLVSELIAEMKENDSAVYGELERQETFPPGRLLPVVRPVHYNLDAGEFLNYLR